MCYQLCWKFLKRNCGRVCGDYSLVDVFDSCDVGVKNDPLTHRRAALLQLVGLASRCGDCTALLRDETTYAAVITGQARAYVFRLSKLDALSVPPRQDATGVSTTLAAHRVRTLQKHHCGERQPYHYLRRPLLDQQVPGWLYFRRASERAIGHHDDFERPFEKEIKYRVCWQPELVS